MTDPVVHLIPHGEPGHFETRLCQECSAFLNELAKLDRQMLQLCDLGFAEIASTDHRGERSYRLTPAGARWLEHEKARRGGAW